MGAIRNFTNLVVSAASYVWTPEGGSPVYLGYSFDPGVFSHAFMVSELESPTQATGLSDAKKLSERATLNTLLAEMSLTNLSEILGQSLTIETDGSYQRLPFGGGHGLPKGQLECYCMAPDSKRRKITLYRAFITADAKDYNIQRDIYTTLPVIFSGLIDDTRDEDEAIGEIEDKTNQDYTITTGLESS